jgi:hypothetical protein
MTTKTTKPTTREISAYVRDRGLRPLIVTLHGPLIELRAKGLRQREVLDLAAVYGMAVRARMAVEKAERAAKRKGKGSRR